MSAAAEFCLSTEARHEYRETGRVVVCCDCGAVLDTPGVGRVPLHTSEAKR